MKIPRSIINCIVMLVVATVLFPIIMGAKFELEHRQNELRRLMRQEHLLSIARDHDRNWMRVVQP